MRILNENIDKLRLNVRTYNKLMWYSRRRNSTGPINTVSDLLNKTEKEIYSYSDFIEASDILEIKNALSDYGLSLKVA